MKMAYSRGSQLFRGGLDLNDSRQQLFTLAQNATKVYKFCGKDMLQIIKGKLNKQACNY